MISRRINESKAVISNVMLPSQANPSGNVHGGEIMKLMDTAASVTAMRHCRKNVVTLRVDELIFHQPIYVGDLVTVNSKIIFVGKSSMEIEVSVCVENLTDNNAPRLAQTAFFTFVALDSDGHTIKVPELILETDEDKHNFVRGELRYKQYKAKKKSNIN